MTTTADHVTMSDLRAAIDKLPRAGLAFLPTPLQLLPRLSAELGGPPIYLKRDDLTGLAFGGNKVRKLDFFLGEAQRQECNVLVAGGGRAQSNHARQCAAAARAVGMHPVLVLQGGGLHQELQGNLLLDHLLGAEVHFVEPEQIARDGPGAVSATMDRLAGEERARGNRPYVIHGSSQPLGTVGYVECALELAEECARRDLDVRDVYVASYGGTQAGLLLGAGLLGAPWRITGGNPGASHHGPEFVLDVARRTAELLGLEPPPIDGRFRTVAAAGPGYGILTPEAREAIRLLAHSEGVFLDPVYSGKGFAVLIRDIREQQLNPAYPVVFVHTGGLPALFAYQPELLDDDGPKSGR
ncbi:MAG: pyridoxal-phosphate dependent enzyme [Thermomicrobiales bacterium]